MPHSDPAATPVDFLLQLLQATPEQHGSVAHLSKLNPVALDYLQRKAADLHHCAVGEARELLDIALESLDLPLSLEHQRRLIERADDELASAQRWGELAANARFCLQRPELAQQLAGDARATGSDDAAGDGGKRSRGRERSAG
ncbi:hypothetical protein IEQ11_21475 [Lysobacter capsici]|uniref:hypothetical protein n=1 Tax=Lysobacter capsici TaxID=435897 RepID=UPI00178696E1|nr:hypothetical protein [Lysobacter capsici]UOF14267.1 hypothetical protein IEQ11_21475 [Lysobacter capsici]